MSTQNGIRERELTKAGGLPLGVCGVRRLRVTQLLSDVTVGGAGGGVTGLMTMAGSKTVPSTISRTGDITKY